MRETPSVTLLVECSKRHVIILGSPARLVTVARDAWSHEGSDTMLLFVPLSANIFQSSKSPLVLCETDLATAEFLRNRLKASCFPKLTLSTI